MSRQRKSNFDAAPIPLAVPAPDLPPPTEPPNLEISEEEQWRLVAQSGVLNKISSESPQAGSANTESEDLDNTFCDEIFNAVLLIIPFSSLLLLMETLIRHQYGKSISMEAILDRMLPGVPILSVFIFYTTRYKHHSKMQLLLFIISTLVGSRMIFQLNRANWLANMQQCPPLATIWIYCIIQLDLGLAVLNLLAVGAFVWWKALKILQ